MVIASHVVIQAGTRIGSGCRIGPQAVVGSHPMAALKLSELKGIDSPVVGKQSTICALSRVIHSVAAGETVSGDPAQPLL